jgi:glycolate oxidase iron-sulfur subunit
MARETVRAFERADQVVVPSAGCSAHMREYGDLLADDPQFAARAARVAERTTDLVAWLATRADFLRFVPDPRRVVYHPPCHHVHAQGLVEAPFGLLGRVPRLRVTRIPEEERCCGSAGSYSLSHPDLAAQVRAEKLDRILEAEPDLLITANPGCELYLQQGLRERGRDLPVVHLAPFLADHLLESS